MDVERNGITALCNALTITLFCLVYLSGILMGAFRVSHFIVGPVCGFSVYLFVLSQLLFAFSNKKTSLEKNILAIGVILLSVVTFFRTLNDIYYLTNIRSLIWPHVGLTFVIVGCITICFIRDGIFKGHGRN